MKSIPNKAVIEEVALELGIDEAFIEKDWYVTQVIEKISTSVFPGFTMIFTGGTALSKAHGLISRFSEDLDFRVICPSLEEVSHAKQRQKLSNLKNELAEILAGEFKINPEKIIARNGNRFFSFELEYPTAFSPNRSLRPHILVEFTISTQALPSIGRPVSSFINKVSGQSPEIEKIESIDPVENAADKLSAFVWRISDRVRGEQSKDDPTIVRHIHDLSILADIAMEHSDFSALVVSVVKNDNSRCSKIEGLPLADKFNYVLSIIEQEYRLYQDEYTTFVQGMSYAKAGTVPPFEQAIERVRALLAHILK